MSHFWWLKKELHLYFWLIPNLILFEYNQGLIIVPTSQYINKVWSKIKKCFISRAAWLNGIFHLVKPLSGFLRPSPSVFSQKTFLENQKHRNIYKSSQCCALVFSAKHARWWSPVLDFFPGFKDKGDKSVHFGRLLPTFSRIYSLAPLDFKCWLEVQVQV